MNDEVFTSIEVDSSDFPDLENASEGVEGKGTFVFKVSSKKGGDRLVIDLFSIKLETENRADKALKDLVGDTNNPPVGEPSEAGGNSNEEVDVY